MKKSVSVKRFAGVAVYRIPMMVAICVLLAGYDKPSDKQDANPKAEEHTVAQSDILAVKEKHEPQLLAISGVVGVGITERNGKQSIVLFVEENTEQIKQAAPKSLEGYPVVIEAIGAVRAQ
jgi:hypothetical protein